MYKQYEALLYIYNKLKKIKKKHFPAPGGMRKTNNIGHPPSFCIKNTTVINASVWYATIFSSNPSIHNKTKQPSYIERQLNNNKNALDE